MELRFDSRPPISSGRRLAPVAAALLLALCPPGTAAGAASASPATSRALRAGGLASEDVVAPQPPVTCITSAHPCVAVPVTIVRNTPDSMRAYSVTLHLSSNLALCDSNIVEGPYLAQAGLTVFEVRDRGAGLYTVDCAILGLPCGATAPSGTLFTLKLGSAAPSATDTVALASLLLRDCDNHPVSGTAGEPALVGIANSPPAPIAGLTATQVRTGNDHDGTTDIAVSWPAEAPGAAVEVYRAGYGNYPEYDDPPAAGSVPATPSYPPGLAWSLAGTVTEGTSLVDAVGTRGFWYYVAFVRDACGNVSAVSNKTTGTLDYHLGDVHDGVTACAGNDQVSTEDISFLGAHYGASLGAADPLGCLDVGPTTDLSVSARPLTDNVLDFEDLMMFALNWHQVSEPGLAALPVAAEPNRLWLEGPASVRAGETFGVTLRLQGAGDLHGISARLQWNHAVAEPVGFEAGSLIGTEGGVVFSARPGSVDAALLGERRGIAGDGDLAAVVFRALQPGDPGVTLATVDARDAQNRKVSLGPASAAPPAVTSLQPASPNPFAGRTALAFSLAKGGPVTLAIYSVDGRRVATLVDGVREAGTYRLAWDGAGAGPGLYYARLSTREGRFIRALVLIR